MVKQDVKEWERVIDLVRYYPEFLKDNRELKQITGTEGEEIRRLYAKSDQLWSDGFIREATIQGIKRWESLLGIKPWTGDTLEERRSAILGRWNRQLPYTLPRLRERLSAVVGQDGYEIYLRNKLYELEVDIIDQPYRVLQSLRDMTQEMIPANLFFIFAGKYPTKIPVDIRTESGLILVSEFFARNNRAFLYLDGTWFLDDTYSLNGYKTEVGLDFFPVILYLLGGVEVEKSGCAALSIWSEVEERQRTETELKAVSQAENHTGYENQMGIWSQIGVLHELAAKILYAAQARHRILPDTGFNIGDEAELDIQEGSNVGIRSQTAIQKSLGSRISFPTAAGVKSREEIRTTLRSGADFSIKETATTKVQAQAAIAVKTDLGLRAEKNLWYLDGTYLLDGTKLLNAAITNYKL